MTPLRFILGEINDTLPNGTHVRADLFERRDGQWSWSVWLTSPITTDEPVIEGPHLCPNEAEADGAALAWISAHTGRPQ